MADDRYSVTAQRLSFQLKDPRSREAAVAELAEAFRAVNGNAVHASEDLGISHRALSRWVAEYPELRRELDRARALAAPEPALPPAPKKTAKKAAAKPAAPAVVVRRKPAAKR